MVAVRSLIPAVACIMLGVSSTFGANLWNRGDVVSYAWSTDGGPLGGQFYVWAQGVSGAPTTTFSLSYNGNPVTPDVVGLAFDRDGNMLTTSYNDGNIYKVTPAGVLSLAATLPNNNDGYGNTGLAVDAQSNLYAVDYDTSELYRATPNSSGGWNTPVAIPDPSGLLVAPTYGIIGLAVDRNDNVYIANPEGQGKIVKYSSTDGVLSTFYDPTVYSFGATHPYDLTIDADGNLYIADQANDTIQKFGHDADGLPTGTPTAFAYGIDNSQGGRIFTGPHAIAVDADGNVYLTSGGTYENHKYIIEYNATGVLIKSNLPMASLDGLAYPTGINLGGGDVAVVPAAACTADFNGDHVRDVADLFGYINAWLAKTTNADFNHDSVVDVADLFGFINAWLAGC